MTEIISWEEIENVMYLNLNYRKIRQTKTLRELKLFLSPGVIPIRQPAIRSSKHKNLLFRDGEFGRYKGHIAMLQHAVDENWNHILICEDDIEFLDIPECRSHLNGLLDSNRAWDVILLSGINFSSAEGNDYPIENSTPNSIFASQTQTSACYLVNGQYILTLLEMMKKGYKHLKGSMKIAKNTAKGIPGWKNPFGEYFNLNVMEWIKFSWQCNQVKMPAGI
jgi:hypothetical protein